MILWKGNSQDEFFEKLEELSELTQQDCIIRNGTKINAECVKTRKGTIENWKISVSDFTDGSGKKRKGTNRNPLLETIKNITNEDELETTDFVVLAFAEAKTNRRFDGQIISSWFKLNPLAPFKMENGKPVFEMEELILPDHEFKMMMETEIAFMTGNILYPLRAESLNSVGRILDARVAFKTTDPGRLGTALVIAEKLGYFETIRLLCRKRDKISSYECTYDVRPVLSLVGKRYGYYPQYDFFMEVFDWIAEMGIYSINKWSIDDDNTSAEVSIYFPSRYQKGILVECGDLFGAPMRVTSYIEIGKNKVYLHSNSLPHTLKQKKEGISSIFDGIKESFETFENELNSISGKMIFFQGLPKKFYNKIGSKKLQNLKIPDCGYYDCIELFELLCDTINFDSTSYKLRNLRQSLYSDIFKTFVQEAVERSA